MSKAVGITTADVRIEAALRRFALGLPVFIILYGFGISLGWLDGSPIFSSAALWIVTIVSLGLAIMETLILHPTSNIRVFYLLSHHVLLIFALLFVFGVLSPLVLAWLLLLVLTAVYFGRYWAGLSYLILLGVMLLNLLVVEPHTPSVIAEYALTAALFAVIAVAFGTLKNLEQHEQRKLVRSQQRTSEQREALLAVINGTSQAILTTGAQGTVRVYNAAMLSLLDTNQSLSGRSIDDVLPVYDLQDKPVSLHKLMQKNSHFERDDLVLKFGDDDSIRLHVTANRVQSAYSQHHTAKNEGFICIIRDVTKEKSLEEERDEFISVISHELRTPVAITEGTLSNAQYFLAHGSTPEKLAPALQEAHDQITLLANMINDLGTLSRAERGVGDTTEEIDVRALADELYKKYQPAAVKKGLGFDLDAHGQLGTITTSRLYLEEMLQNLITNAIKYTQKGQVTLSIQRTNDGVSFAVKDTGIGIGKTDLKHIFEKFYRSEDYRTRETSGTGLGLYVVHKLMKKLGTSVEVSSRLNHGSTFSFAMPLSGQVDESKKTAHT